MCDINFSKKTTDNVGYKVLAYKKGKYYSTFTGQRIKAGDVPLPPKQLNRLSTIWSDDILRKNFSDSIYFDRNVVGFTSVFKDIKEAKYLKDLMTEEDDMNDYEIVVVKIKFADDSNNYLGKYNIDGIFIYFNADIIAGNKIKSIKQIKD